MVEESEAQKDEGWAFPGNSRKAHYFVDARSLCRKWGFYLGSLEKGNDDSPDNCVACMRALAKRQKNNSK